MLVADLADYFLHDVLEVDHSGGRRTPSTTTTICRPAAGRRSSSGSRRMVSGTITGGTISADGDVRPTVMRHRDGLLDVDQPVDVVPVVAHDGNRERPVRLGAG